MVLLTVWKFINEHLGINDYSAITLCPIDWWKTAEEARKIIQEKYITIKKTECFLCIQVKRVLCCSFTFRNIKSWVGGLHVPVAPFMRGGSVIRHWKHRSSVPWTEVRHIRLTKDKENWTSAFYASLEEVLIIWWHWQKWPMIRRQQREWFPFCRDWKKPRAQTW